MKVSHLRDYLKDIPDDWEVAISEELGYPAKEFIFSVDGGYKDNSENRVVLRQGTLLEDVYADN